VSIKTLEYQKFARTVTDVIIAFESFKIDGKTQ